jgi:serine/threonine protein kinase
MIGTTVAHYRITAALGAGGMGEVWRATDTKLGREVALKVLPEEFAKDPNRMARFEREAKGKPYRRGTRPKPKDRVGWAGTPNSKLKTQN